MSDVLIDDIDTGSADASATGDNEILISDDVNSVIVDDEVSVSDDVNSVIVDDEVSVSDDSAASSPDNNVVVISYDELIVSVDDIKNILTDEFENTEDLTEFTIDDVYNVLLDLKSIGSCILIIFVASVTISVFRKLFDVF